MRAACRRRRATCRPRACARRPCRASWPEWRRRGRSRPPQRRRAARSWLCEEDLLLRLLEAWGRRRRNAPLVDATRRPLPVVGSPDPVAVVDLLDLRRVFDDDTEWIDEVVERVVARPVPAR